LILKESFGFLELAAPKAISGPPVFNNGMQPETMWRPPRLVLARLLANCFANEMLTRDMRVRLFPAYLLGGPINLTHGFESCTPSPEVSGERMTDGAQPV
jgi:hypothetical protein